MKKYIVGTLLAAVLLLGAHVNSAQAAGLSSTQVASIISLLNSFDADPSTVEKVKSSLSNSTSSSNSTSACAPFTRDLKVGSTGKDVGELFKLLKEKGFLKAAKKGEKFDSSTVPVIRKFQAHYGIKQTGSVGPTTRAKLAELSGCQ